VVEGRYTLAQVAAKLGISVDAVRRRVRSRALPADRDNRGQWWVTVDLEALPPEPPSFTKRAAPIERIGATIAEEMFAELRRRAETAETALAAERQAREAERAAAAEERERLVGVVEQLGRDAAAERVRAAEALEAERARHEARLERLRARGLFDRLLNRE
jgi:hypothetical protein